MPPTFTTATGVELELFDHPYNVTINNERAIELALAQAWLEEVTADCPGPLLEVGAVTPHYFDHGGTVIDLHERGPGIQNHDARTWYPPVRYAQILSISTIEHVGWDQPDPDPTDAEFALRRMVGSLAPGGHAFITIPIGYHPPLDESIARLDVLMRGVELVGDDLYVRTAAGGWAAPDEWHGSLMARHLLVERHPYDRGIPSARAVWVAHYRADT